MRFLLDESAEVKLALVLSGPVHRGGCLWHSDRLSARARGRILKLNMVEYLGTAAKGRQFVEMDLNEPPLRFDRVELSLDEAMAPPTRRSALHGRRRADPPQDGLGCSKEAVHQSPPAG
jgi:hypothetical protein